MDKKKIIWTITTVAMTGAFASTFFCDYDEDAITYKIISSGGFAFVAGLMASYTYFLYEGN